jgi:hypothetical protein
MDYKKLFLIGAGLLFVAVGLSNLFDPRAAMASIELKAMAVSTLNEVRANYGGMHSFLGIFFIYSAFTPRLQSAALVFVTIFSSGLVLGRIVSLAVDGAPNAAILVFLAIEVFGAIAGLVLLRRSSHEFH